MKNLIGQRFGKLVATAEAGRNKKRQVLWRCQCDCGATVIRDGSTLQCYKSKSCGCARFNPRPQQRHAIVADAATRRSYRAYIQAAFTRGLTFTLTYDDYQRVSSAACDYCGTPPAQLKRTRYDVYVANGIDRIDNNIGYDASNSVPCCHRCNFMKRAMGRQEFIDAVERIVAHQRRRHLAIA